MGRSYSLAQPVLRRLAEGLRHHPNLMVGTVATAALVVFSYIARTHFGEMDLMIAWRGWSVVDFTNSVLKPENFREDFPGGAQFIGKSVIVWFYPLLERILGISSYTTLLGVIFVQIVFVALAAAVLARVLLKQTTAPAYVIFILLALLGGALSIDLARFGDGFIGQFYSFAHGLRMLAIASLLSRRLLLTTALLCVAYAVHPSMTIAVLPAMASLFVLDRGLRSDRNAWIAGLVFIAFAAVWSMLFVMEGDAPATIPNAEYFKYSRLLNYHWYLSELGAIVQNPGMVLLPFFSMLMIGLEALRQSDADVQLKRQLYLAVIAIVVVSLLGIAASEGELSQSITKLSPQRSSAVAAVLLLPFVINRFVLDFANARMGPLLLGFAILVSWLDKGKGSFPFVMALCYASPAYVALFRRQPRRGGEWMVAAVTVLPLLLIVAQWSYGHFQISQYRVTFATGVILLIGTLWLHFPDLVPFRLKTDRSVPAYLLWIAIAVLAAVGMQRQHRIYSVPNKLAVQARDYLDAQLWARENTEKTSLFMTEPCRNYGWRDFSQRSSWGTYHEFLKTGWLYTSNSNNFREGISRAQRLGIEVDKILEKHPKGVAAHNEAFCAAARATYYTADRSWLAAMAKDYGIDYFLFFKSEARLPMPSTPVYQNNTLYILDAQDQL